MRAVPGSTGSTAYEARADTHSYGRSGYGSTRLTFIDSITREILLAPSAEARLFRHRTTLALREGASKGSGREPVQG
jgi:hypothetical protein